MTESRADDIDRVRLHSRSCTARCRFGDLLVYGLVFMVPIAPFGIFGSVFQGSGGMVALAYAIGMVAMMFTALSYSQMSQAFPMAGSVYTYAGRGIAAPVGFLSGWMILLDYVLVPAPALPDRRHRDELADLRGPGLAVADRLRGAQHGRELHGHRDDRQGQQGDARRGAGRARDLHRHRHRRARAGQGPRLRLHARSTTRTRSPGRWCSARSRSRCCRSSASTASRCSRRRTRSRPADRPLDGGGAAAGRVAVHRADLGRLAAGARPGRADQQGRPRRHGLLRRRRGRRAARGCPSSPRSRPRSPGASRTRSSRRPRPPGCSTRWPATGSCRPSWPRCTRRRACRSTRRCWSRSSRWASGSCSTRWRTASPAVHAGELRCAHRVPGAARLGGLALRRPARQPALVAHLVAPVIGFAILAYVLVNAQVYAQSGWR